MATKISWKPRVPWEIKDFQERPEIPDFLETLETLNFQGILGFL